MHWDLHACQHGELGVQADIVHILNRELSTDFDLEQPWTAFDIGAVGSADGTAMPGGVSDDPLPNGNESQPATLLHGIELPSDTDDSSYRCLLAGRAAG